MSLEQREDLINNDIHAQIGEEASSGNRHQVSVPGSNSCPQFRSGTLTSPPVRISGSTSDDIDNRKTATVNER